MSDAATTDNKQPYEDPNRPWSPEELNEPLNPDELKAIHDQLPLLNEVIEWFEEKLAAYRDPEVIEGVNVSSNAQQVKDSVLFAQSLIRDYKYKRKEFADRFRKYIDMVKPQE